MKDLFYMKMSIISFFTNSTNGYIEPNSKQIPLKNVSQ